MSEIHTLDVTRIEPKRKHPTIFQHFDALEEGQAFIIHNDHDPKPLYYQLLAERGKIFNWEYLTAGPQVWEIKVAKKKISTGEETIGEIAGKDLRKAEVFKKLGLEFCCGGHKSLEQSCEDAGVSLDEVTRALNELPAGPVSSDRNYYDWNLDFLADYIVNIHHKYVNDVAPMLIDLSAKIDMHHGMAHPELSKIQLLVEALLTEMKSHQLKEEKVLFPYIKQLVRQKTENKPDEGLSAEKVEEPVKMMMDEHREVARLVHSIEKLSTNYTVPPDGCQSYHLYYHKLREFDEDLHQHIHLENNILFPKAVALTQELTH
jgi:regulator of cell morphogenesis and NO signaling